MFYFGYGANQTPEMMEAIIGREPAGQPAVLPGYELVIQQPGQIPAQVREVLLKSWSVEEVANFKTYAVRPADGTEVYGTLWEITQQERRHVDRWEMNNGLWYQKISVAVFAGGADTQASTEMINNPALRRATPADPVFLNNKPRLLEVATQLRKSIND